MEVREFSKYNGETRYFSATIGRKSKHHTEKVCLENVQAITGDSCDAHTWVNSEKLGKIKEGKTVTFRAEVVSYERLTDNTRDYGLEKIREIKAL